MNKKLIDFSEIDIDGEIWEFFARDFLQELGFFIESTPDRGPDGGKDLLISEELQGNLNQYRFKWLVSCKHFAKSNKSVSEKDEINIQERIDSFKADGFIGFYSTLPSSGLNTRLTNLKDNNKIKDYRVFDSKLIENYLIRIGFSKLLMRYLPISYKKIKPLHLITNEFIPLKCASCGKELIESLNYENYQALISQVSKYDETTNTTHIIDVYWACKGACDTKIEDKYFRKLEATTAWEDISDLTIPVMFLNWVISIMNSIKNGSVTYTEEAFEKEKHFILAMSQKVLREMTEDERKRASLLFQLSNI